MLFIFSDVFGLNFADPLDLFCVDFKVWEFAAADFEKFGTCDGRFLSAELEFDKFENFLVLYCSSS